MFKGDELKPFTAPCLGNILHILEPKTNISYKASLIALFHGEKSTSNLLGFFLRTTFALWVFAGVWQSLNWLVLLTRALSIGRSGSWENSNISFTLLPELPSHRLQWAARPTLLWLLTLSCLSSRLQSTIFARGGDYWTSAEIGAPKRFISGVFNPSTKAHKGQILAHWAVSSSAWWQSLARTMAGEFVMFGGDGRAAGLTGWVSILVIIPHTKLEGTHHHLHHGSLPSWDIIWYP